MAIIKIQISEEEKINILRAIIKLKDKATSVATIAREAKGNPNRVRFVIDDLLEEKRIERVVLKAFNDKYIRYKYQIRRT